MMNTFPVTSANLWDKHSVITSPLYISTPAHTHSQKNQFTRSKLGSDGLECRSLQSVRQYFRRLTRRTTLQQGNILKQIYSIITPVRSVTWPNMRIKKQLWLLSNSYFCGNRYILFFRILCMNWKFKRAVFIWNIIFWSI